MNVAVSARNHYSRTTRALRAPAQAPTTSMPIASLPRYVTTHNARYADWNSHNQVTTLADTQIFGSQITLVHLGQAFHKTRLSQNSNYHQKH